MKDLVLASGNRGKLRELSLALAPLDWRLRPISEWTEESPEETGTSFEANALLKARHAARLTGLPCLADDSGLAVDALDGAPGVYSARYAGAHANDQMNNAKLLAALDGTPVAQRGARFICVIAWVSRADDPAPVLARGEWQGEILPAPRGDGGFGYDPLFLDRELGLSAAELGREQKLARSHRGAAIRALLERLRQTGP